MSSQLLYQTQRIRGFQHEGHEISKGKLIWHIRRRKIKCRHCGNEKVQKEGMKRRRIRGLSSGTPEVFFEFDVHCVYCPMFRVMIKASMKNDEDANESDIFQSLIFYFEFVIFFSYPIVNSIGCHL